MNTPRPPATPLALSLEVTEVAPGSWRICNAENDEQDARRVVGFIGMTGAGAYEALALRPAPHQCGIHHHWSDAFTALRSALSEPSPTRR